MFDINEKVALVTGGASGIGLETARQLLANGARGVALADINSETGKAASKKLGEEFGKDKVIFIKTDVSDKTSFEDAFKRTVDEFKNIDILVNNAGILDDVDYEKEISINMTGVTHGIVLALKNYIAKHKSGSEGVIINTASVAGLRIIPFTPIYGAIKSAVISLTMAFGNKTHFDRTKVRVVALAPGAVATNINHAIRFYDDFCRDALMSLQSHIMIQQSAEFVAKSMVKVITEKPTGTIWIAENNQEIYEHSPSVPTPDFGMLLNQ